MTFWLGPTQPPYTAGTTSIFIFCSRKHDLETQTTTADNLKVDAITDCEALSVFYCFAALKHHYVKLSCCWQRPTTGNNKGLDSALSRFISSHFSCLHWTPASHNPSLCPCSISIRELAALIRWCCCTWLISWGNRWPHLIKWLEANGFSGARGPGARVDRLSSASDSKAKRAFKPTVHKGCKCSFWYHLTPQLHSAQHLENGLELTTNLWSCVTRVSVDYHSMEIQHRKLSASQDWSDLYWCQ